jgi:hypothetical protein
MTRSAYIIATTWPETCAKRMFPVVAPLSLGNLSEHQGSDRKGSGGSM